MRKIEMLDVTPNRYYVGTTTCGSTQDYLITDGSVVLKLVDCLIFDDMEADDFDETVALCKADPAGMMYAGWSIV